MEFKELKFLLKKLFREFLRVTKLLKPKYIIGENVKGLLSRKTDDDENSVIEQTLLEEAVSNRKKRGGGGRNSRRQSPKQDQQDQGNNKCNCLGASAGFHKPGCKRA